MLERDELFAPGGKSESSTAPAEPGRARTPTAAPGAAPAAVVTVSAVLSVVVAKLATSVSLRLSNRVSVRLRRVVSRLALVPQPAPVIEEGLIMRIANRTVTRPGRVAFTSVRLAESFRLAVQK